MNALKKRDNSDEELVVERMTRPQTSLQRLRTLLERSKAPLLFSDRLTSDDIRRSLDETGVAIVDVSNEDTTIIQTRIGNLIAETFPNLSKTSRDDLSSGRFGSTSQEWTNRKVSETGITLRSYRMPVPIPLVANRQARFTDPVLKSVHLKNPLLAKAPLCVWEQLSVRNPSLHPAQWFGAAGRMLCSEDGIKFANQVSYAPTRIHYDGQPERVQIMFTTDSGPVRLFAVPGSGTQEAQELISEILGIQMLGGFSTHTDAFEKHPDVQKLLHEFGVAVPKNGLLLWKTRVWHYEAEVKVVQTGQASAVPAVPAVPAVVKTPFNWNNAKLSTKKSNVFRVYCGVVALDNDRRDQLIRHAFFRENNWPMEPFAVSNRRLSPIFVAEKSSQAAERGTYQGLEAGWVHLQSISFDEMKVFLRQISVDRLLLYGLSINDLQ